MNISDDHNRGFVLPTLSSLFKIGDLVVVDGFNQGTIVEKEFYDNHLYFTIIYSIDMSQESDVSYKRCTVVSVATNCHTRNGCKIRIEHYNNPVLNQDSAKSRFNCASSSTTPHTPTNTLPSITHSTKAKPASNKFTKEGNEMLFEDFQSSVMNSYMQTNKTADISKPPVLPLYNFLSSNNSKSKGWLRSIISDVPVRELKDKKLNEKESSVLIFLAAMFLGSSSKCDATRKYNTYLTKAFGIHRTTLKNKIKSFIKNKFTATTNTRSDKGTNVFICDKKRKSTFTPYHSFKKARYSQFRDYCGKISDESLKRDYNNLTAEELEVLQMMADLDYERSKHLKDELDALMLKTNGKLPYSELANQLGNIVSTNTIRSFLKSRPTFRLRKDRTLPYLDIAAKQRRMKWTHDFWVFWQSAKSVRVKNHQIVLMHMDEKWFYAIRNRTNTKVLTEIGLMPHDYHCQHKSHIHKIMYVVATAFVLNNNDIQQGGVCVPISCIRVGKMIPAMKDSYKRVYNNDGSYGFPKLPENLVRKKGNLYWKNLELTGSNEGSLKKPKVSLLKLYRDEIFPSFEEKVVKEFGVNEDGSKRNVVLVHQMDSAGLHNDKKLNDGLEKYHRDRGWLAFRQPSQSPVTNIHDACIFPMMSKAVSNEQCLSYASHVLKSEELHKAVMRVWEDERNLIAMSRAFSGHHQIVCAIMEHKGDNNYLKDGKGMSFGIRRTFVATQDRRGVQVGVDEEESRFVQMGEGSGIEPVDLAPQSFGQTLQGSIEIQNRLSGKLRYEAPDVRTLELAKLSSDMQGFLLENMDPELMTEDVNEYWVSRVWNESQE